MREYMKRTAAVLLVLVFLCGAACGTVMAEETAGEVVSEELQLLKDLGILDGDESGLLNGDKSLTRAEMTKISLRILGISESVQGSDVFADVPASHWAYTYVAAGREAGIIDGVSETEFAPDAALGYEQAVKIVVCLMGYRVQAEALGGYPAGYLAKAAQLGIVKGVPTETEITRASLAKLLYNAFDMDILVRESYGDDAWTYREKAGATLLSEYMQIQKAEGKVTATYTHTILAGRKLGEKDFALDGVVYDGTTVDAASRFGQKVTVYYKENDGERTALALVASKLVKTVSVSAEDVLGDTTASRLCYEGEGKDEKLEIAGAALVYNGIVKSGWTAEDLMPDQGTVTCISNNGGTSYEVIVVDAYVNYVVNRVDVENKMVYFMYDVDGIRNLEINTQQTDVKTVFKTAAGKNGTLSSLRQWNILSVVRSDDGSVLRVISSTDSVSGTPSETSKETVVIADKSYTVAKGLEKHTEMKKPELGIASTYYLDYTGKIAAVSDAVAKDGYGYLMGAFTNKGLDGATQFKIFTAAGKAAIMNAADKVRFNGTVTDGSSLLPKDKNNGLVLRGSVVNQLIRYKTNEAGEIVELETATDYSFMHMAQQKYDCFSLDFTIDSQGKSPSGGPGRFVGGSVMGFAGRYLVRDETTVFFVSMEDPMDEKQYYIGKLSDSDHGDVQNIWVYDTDEDGIISAVVWGIGGTSGLKPTKEPSGVIEKITTGIDAEGLATNIIYLRKQDGAAVTIYAEPEYKALNKVALVDKKAETAAKEASDSKVYAGENTIPVSELAPGDIVQYTVDSKGRATMLNVLFRYAYGALNWEQTYYTYPNFTATQADINYDGSYLQAYFEVERVSKYGMTATVHPKYYENAAIQFTYYRVYEFGDNVILYDSEKQTAKKVASSVINEGDKVFVWRPQNWTFLCVIYR